MVQSLDSHPTAGIGPETTYHTLLRQIRQSGQMDGWNLLAFSGGIDSSLVAHLLFTALPRRSVAVIGVSASLPMDQLDQARAIALEIGIPLRQVPTLEGALPDYIANQGQACYHCKSTLYETMTQATAALELEASQYSGPVRLFNGTNRDDLQDPTRVGLLAAREHRVVSPLQDLTKAQVRALARHVGLSNWNHAASPCLRSRLQYGVMATQENLRRVEAAEQLVRRMVGLQPSDNLRVRHLEDDLATIELDEGPLARARALGPGLIDAVRALEYSRVTLRPFRSGALSQPEMYGV